MSNILNLKGVKLFAIVVLAIAILATFGMVAVQQANAADCTVVPTVRVGSSGASVSCVQSMVGATADGSFGPLTKAAVMAWQSGHSLVADGVVGPMTAAAMNGSMMGGGGSMTYPAGCTSASGYSTTLPNTPCSGGGSLPAGCMPGYLFSPTTGMSCAGGSTPSEGGPLVGTAGSVESYELMPFSNEEVGEDEEDVAIAGLEVEVDDGSDLDLIAVRLNFDQGTATNDDLDEFITEVALMLDGEEVGRVDADGFNEDNDWEKTVSLDGGVCRSGETCDLSVGVTGVGNIDTADEGDTWTVDFEQVRFADAEGTVISEDPGTAVETWSVEAFATAADVELNASLTDAEDAVNESHVVDVDNTDDTDNIEVLAFDLEAEGDSDLDIESIEVDFASTETTGNDPGDIVTQACLWHDGDELDCQNFVETDADSLEAIVFDQLDHVIDAGDTHEFMVTVDAISTGGALDNGDTLTAVLDVSETDVDDESGEQLTGGDLTGSAVAEAVAFFDAGIMAEFVSADETITPVDGGADVVNFDIVFDVTAFDTDAFIDATPIALETGGGGTYQDIDGVGIVATGVLDSSADDAANSTLQVDEGTTERFTLTVSGVGTGAFAQALLESILWATTAIDGDQLYTFNMDEYETASVFVSAT